MSTRKIIFAVNFAAQKHQNQRRKNKEATPYVNHPIEVANLLATVGEIDDEIVLIAALLHDTLEDTATTPEEIKNLFGSEVLSIVQELTDDKTLPKQQRKTMQIQLAPHRSSQAKQIKLADKTCNIISIIDTPPHTWDIARRREYLLWARQVVNGLEGCNKKLENYFDRYYQKALKVLGI